MRLKNSWLALLATTALPALPASAQDPAPQEPPTDLAAASSDLIVTATRRAALQFDTPASTTVVGRNEIQRTRARRTLTDALLDVPSVMVQKTGYGQASPFIRGFTGYQTVMLVDGIRLNNSTFRSGPNQYWATVDAFTVERLEVVRGAASVLYGSDAIGGAVNAIARRPRSFDEGARVSPRTYVRWSDAEGSWTVRGEVEGHVENLGFVAGGTYRTYDDLRIGAMNDRAPGTAYRDTDGDLRLDWRQSENATWTFATQHVDQDDVPRTHKTEDAVPFRGTDVGSELSRDLDQTRDLIYARFSGRNLDSSLFERAEVTVSWHRQREERTRVRDTSRTDIQGATVRTWGFQGQLEADTGLGYLTYGAEWWRDDVSSFRDDFRDGVLDLSRVQGAVADDARYDLVGAYLQDELMLGETTVTAGARYTYAKLRAGRVDNPAVGGGDPATPGNVIRVDDSWDNVVGAVRAVHPLGEGWNLYGGVSQAFRAPNLSDLTRLDATSGVETPSVGLDAEKFISYEVGLKAQHERWSGQLALWRTDIKDLIVPSPTGRLIDATPEVRKSNADDGWVRGVELEVSYRLDGDWTVTGAGSWMDGESDQIDAAGRTVARPLSRLMPLTGTGTVTYAPPGERFRGWLSGRAATRQDDLSLKDESDTSRIPSGGTPRYAVLSIGGSFEIADNATVIVVIDNLWNAEYRIHGSGVTEPGRNVVLALDVGF